MAEKPLSNEQGLYARRTQSVYWTIVFWVALTLLGVVNLMRDIGQLFPGYLVSRQADGGEQWFVDINTPAWWLNEASGAGLASGMALVSLNGQPYDVHHPAVFASMASGTPVTITARTATGLQDFRVMVRPFTLLDLLDFRLPNLLMMISMVLLAVAVYRAQPNNNLNHIAAVTFILVGAVRAMHQGVVFPTNDALDVMLDLLINGVAFNFIGPMCIWLVLLFPQPSRYNRWGEFLVAFGWVLLAPLRVGARLWAILWGANPVTLLLTDVTIGFGMGLCLLAVVIALVRWGRLSFARDSRASAGMRVRPAIFAVWVGLWVSLAPVLIGILSPYTATVSVSYFLGSFDLRYLMLGLPLAMSYAMLRHHTLTGDVALTTAALGLMLASLVAASAANITYHLQWLWLQTDLRRPPFEAMLAVSLVSMLMAQHISTRSLGRLFNRQATHLADVSALSQRLLPHLSHADLPATIPVALAQALHLARVALWLRPPDASHAPFALTAQVGDLAHPLPTQLPTTPAAMPPVIIWVLAEADVPAPLAPLRGQTEWDVALTLTTEDQVLGWLALGQHPDEVFLSPYDRDVLLVLAQNIALVLWANHTLLELRQTPHRLADVQDRERLRLAQDLHDSIQQFLGRLPFQLEISRSLIYTDPAQAEAVLARCLDEVAQAARTVRQIRHDLVPLGVERAFAATLADLAGRFQAEHGVAVVAQVQAEVEHSLSLEARKAIYWVVKQALDNVAAHAAATTVHVCCRREAARVVVEIGDNGRGFGHGERESARARDRFGLQVMQGRLALLGGQLSVDSQPGQGTWVRGWLPVQGEGHRSLQSLHN